MRVARKYLRTNYFHVMVQGINKSYIFEKAIDAKVYIRNMYKTKKKMGVKVLAYCIMSNHAHMLLRVENLHQLSEYMHDINTKYAMYYNKRYSRVGYVFRDRFKAEGIYKKDQLSKCIQYIYNNPVKAGICENPWEYKFSSYKYIHDNSEAEYDFIDVEPKEKIDFEKELNKFLKENKCTFFELKNDKENLHKFVQLLKNDCSMSLREISEKLGLGREMTRKIFNKKPVT